MVAFVILDRDGVINKDSPDYIKTPGEWQPIPGSLESIARLHLHGIPVFVATNQAGIGRDILDRSVLQKIHQKMMKAVRDAGGLITDIEFCPHHPNDNCSCRKPKPGLLQALARHHNLDLAQGCYVGDSLKDLIAAETAGCEGVLVLTGNGKDTLLQRPDFPRVFPDLAAFVDSILN